MRPFTQKPILDEQVTSTGTGDVKTVACPEGTSAVLISVETTAARVTFHGGTPAANLGQVFPAGTAPVYIPVGDGTTIKVASTAAAANAVVNVSHFE